MISFRNDYAQGAHPAVLDALLRTNLESTPGYGEDRYCQQAAQTVRSRFACPQADVHFLVGGTQTNFTTIAAFLRPWEAVIAADTGHIAVHETGAVEARGHKVLTAPHVNGKLTPEAIREVCAAHAAGNPGHMVLPKMVYISDATELGTIYTKKELEALRAVCDQLGLYLYLDGARMGAALTVEGNDLLPKDFPRLCDAFYIGGTKNGLLFGECLVIVNQALQPNFRFALKQGGGMLAKGRLLGLQFQAILENDLWLKLARHANFQAQRLQAGVLQAGYSLYISSPTNQIFPIFSKKKLARLEQSFSFEFTQRIDESHDAIRLVTSWATEPTWVDAFLAAI